MDYRKLEKILFYILLIIVAAVYLYTVAPTLSFWDCGEFISSAYTLAIPHPPGTPFYILLGRVWLMIFGLISAVLPISKEVAWHMNLLGLSFSVITVGLLYRLILKLFRMFNTKSSELKLILISFGTCLSIAFFYTYWQNAIETEVYAASTFIFVLITYLTLLWYESVKEGTPKNRYILFSCYLIFLATGIHLIPFLIFIPFYIFILIVERTYIKDILFLLFGIFQLFFFSLLFLLPGPYQFPAVVVLVLILLAGIILPLNNPRKYRNWSFFWAGIFLVIAGVSSELYLPLRSARLVELYKDSKTEERYLAGENIAPRINECDPGADFKAFNRVLHREQYGPPRLIPRQTQEATGFNLITGYYHQFALFVRYLSWQPMPESMNRVFRGVVLAFFYLFGLWGFVELYKRDRKLFLFMMMIMFMLSFAMVGYLNLKFSPSDSNPDHQPREVRERDYFFHTSHTYFGILIGLGFFGTTEFMRRELKKKKFVELSCLSGFLVFSVIPFFSNISKNNRYGNFIPKDYAYNMLISCDKDAILFTNGDNDTFPLWFAQEVLGIRRDVIIANLSLINTNWYIKQLKYWGAPITFSEYIIDRLEPFMTRDRRIFYVKDIMIRHIIAANAGVKLKNEDYTATQQDFASRYLKGYSGKRPIYFASTVSRENYEGFIPYLRLEGLVYRVVGDSSVIRIGSGNQIAEFSDIDIAKTETLFYKTYRYTGVFEPVKYELLSKILVDFEKRKQEGEFYDFSLPKDENIHRLYSNYAAGLHTLGIVLQERGDIQGTLRAWRFARLFDAGQARFFDYNLALLFAQLGMEDSAEQYFSKIKAKDPGTLMRIGSIYRAMGKYDKAIEYFQRAITLNPRIPETYFGLYTLYLENKDSTAAIGVLNDWLKINPRDTSAINMLKELTGK